MVRNFRMIALAAALFAGAGPVAAQDFVFSWNPRTGDIWVDNRLDDINNYGYRYRDPFVDEMVRYYGAPRDLVTDLLVNRRWAPGDVYYACALAQAAGRPCRTVVDEWERDHGQGWGVIAQRMGIKPGSEEFHRLKRGFVPTYDRWGRPIVLDDGLRDAYPERARTHARGGYDSRFLERAELRGPGNGKSRPGRDQSRGKDGTGRDDHGRGHDKAQGGPPSGKGKSHSGRGDDGHGRGGHDHAKDKGGDKGGHGKGKGQGQGQGGKG